MYCPYNNICHNCQLGVINYEDTANNYCDYFRMNSPDNPITITNKEVRTSNDKIRENLRIPVLKGPINAEILKFMNKNIESDIMEFKSQMETASDESYEKAMQAGRRPVPYDISNIYAVTYNKNNIVSISIIYDELIDGRHYYIRVTYNYDIKNGRSLSVLDLFKPGVDGKSLINSEIMKELGTNPQKYFPGAINNFKGISPDQPFYIDNNTLVLFFGFNEIAPIASQIPTISIPLSKFKDSIKPQLLRQCF